MATKSKSKQKTSAGKPPATKKTAVKPKAKIPVKSSTKPKAAVQKKGTTAATKRGSAKPTPKKNIFAGASEISITENNIAVTRSVSKSVNGKYSERTTREYHDQTPANMRAVNDIVSKSAVKKITVKLK